MATCPVCKESMLTERPHVHGGFGRLGGPSDREPELVLVGKDEWERLRSAIEAHRENVMKLGYKVNERTHEPEWGGEYDRRLWAVLPDEPAYSDEKKALVMSNWPLGRASDNAATTPGGPAEGDGHG